MALWAVIVVALSVVLLALGIAQYRRWTSPAVEVVAGLFPPAPADPIRVLSCNVQGIPLLHHGDRMTSFLQKAQAKADVICLQELFSVGAIEQVRETLSGWTLLLPRPYASGLCIATRLHASEPRSIHYSAAGWSDRFVTKGAMAVDVEGPSGPLTVVVTHMQNAGPIASQYTELREWMRERPARGTLLVGDFNVDPSRTKEELPPGGCIVRTHEATHEAGEIDYGWATPDIAVEVTTMQPGPADHVPLLYQVVTGRKTRPSAVPPRQAHQEMSTRPHSAGGISPGAPHPRCTEARTPVRTEPTKLAASCSTGDETDATLVGVSRAHTQNDGDTQGKEGPP